MHAMRQALQMHAGTQWPCMHAACGCLEGVEGERGAPGAPGCAETLRIHDLQRYEGAVAHRARAAACSRVQHLHAVSCQ
jgi:hypothetical protein